MSSTGNIEMLYDVLFDKAASVIKGGVQHEPFIFVLKTDGQIGIVPCVTAPSKDAIFALHKDIAKEDDVEATFLVMEAWVLDNVGLTKEETREMIEVANRDGIKDHPRSKEAVVFTVLTRDRQAIASCPIARETNTLRKVDLMWIDSDPSVIVGGDLIRDLGGTVH